MQVLYLVSTGYILTISRIAFVILWVEVALLARNQTEWIEDSSQMNGGVMGSHSDWDCSTRYFIFWKISI